MSIKSKYSHYQMLWYGFGPLWNIGFGNYHSIFKWLEFGCFGIWWFPRKDEKKHM